MNCNGNNIVYLRWINHKQRNSWRIDLQIGDCYGREWAYCVHLLFVIFLFDKKIDPETKFRALSLGRHDAL